MRMHNKAILILIVIMLSLAFASCGGGEEAEYSQVDTAKAKQLMETEDNYVILDVRTDEEYSEGHIPGAMLIPDYEIEDKVESMLKDKEQLILVYCRSGNRSKGASEALAKLGYTNVVEFGGIIDWPYEIER